MSAPLDGIRILDFTRFQNGPHATVMLADLGADVLKIELPGQGDPGRSLGRLEDGFCAYLEAMNRGKRSMALDLNTPEAIEIIKKLVPQMDVLTENFRPGVLDRLGLGYDDLRDLNPQLIYATNSGFGPKGEWREHGSFDHVSQGMSGAMIAQAGGPGKEPLAVAWGLADQVGSMLFAFGILGALMAREKHGIGQRIDVSQLGAMMTLQSFSIVGYLHTREQPTRDGGKAYNPTFAWYQGSDDEWFTIGVLEQKFWPVLCRVIERDDLIDDPRYVDPLARSQHGEPLAEELRNVFATRTRKEWLTALLAKDIPAAPVYDYAGVVADPQFRENGYLVELEHPHFEHHETVGVPVIFSETPASVRSPAPELGQHTEEVLLDLGYDWSDIERLHDAGVTAARG